MKRAGAFENKNAKKVATHYNQHKQQSEAQRKHSDIYNLRRFNNWIKSCLIAKFIVNDAFVLDLGCGKGGDLRKYATHKIKYYMGLDIAEQSVKDNIGRYKEMKEPFDAKFVALDCFSYNWSILATEQFDLVSSQFCFHYAFESAKKVKNTLHNVSQVLKSGGYWVATIPNEDVIINRLQYAEKKQNGTVFGNDIYSVRVDQQWASVFGRQYYFSLQDAVDDCPEYIVPWKEFTELFTDVGFELVFKKSFEKLLSDAKKDPFSKDLFTKMMRMGIEDDIMDDEQWEVASFYQAFVLRKK